MGMTLWLHTLEEGTCSRQSTDHSWMHRLSDELDDICTEEGVTKLSDFFDYSDIEFNHGDEFAGEFDEEDDTPEDAGLPPETGLGHGVDDMAWFEAEDGIATLSALRDVVEGSGLPELAPRDKDDLLEEIEDCLTRLEDTATRDGRFHLAVVE